MIVLSNFKYFVEVALLIFLISGFFIGWKRGFITSLVSFIFTILIFVGAFYLKNYISVFFYENLPFIDMGGPFTGITSLNILLYEAVAFIICVIVLVIIAIIIAKISNLVNKLVNATVILELPNKILGSILTVIQFFIIGYFILLIMLQIPYTNRLFRLNDSRITTFIVDKTPGLSQMTKKYYNTYKEIYTILDRNENSTDKARADYDTLEVLLKNEIVTPISVRKLVDSGKLKIENVNELITKYNK